MCGTKIAPWPRLMLERVSSLGLSAAKSGFSPERRGRQQIRSVHEMMASAGLPVSLNRDRHADATGCPAIAMSAPEVVVVRATAGARKVMVEIGLMVEAIIA